MLEPMLIATALVIAAFLVLVASQAVMYLRRIRFSESLVARSVCAQSVREDARKTIVVLGDSTAVGVGAGSPDHSVAGRLAAAFPEARVYNYSKSGARARHVMSQLDRFPHARADVVLVQVCANDVVGVHRIDLIEAHLRAVIARAKGLGARVFLMPGNNFCIAPFFVWPAQPVLTWRAVRIHAMLQRLADETQIDFVDLLCDPREDPFAKEPHRYYCEDLIHPSAEGYALYFTALVTRGRLGQHLAG
jgi:lysophospholipase L1-like esterase